MGWWNEPFQKWDFKFRGRSWKKIHCSWQDGHIIGTGNTWIFRKCLRKKFFVHNFCHNLGQTILHQFDHSPPPIWSLGFTWFVGFLRISFDISYHICSKWQCSEPHIMYYTIFGSGFSRHLPLGVDQANLVIYTLNFVLVLLGNATCTGMMYTTADWSSRFLRNITAFASEFHHYWSAILKIRGGILHGVFVLKKTGAGIWGEGSNQVRWLFMIVIAFISSLSVEQCQASISNTVSPENHSKLTVLLLKKIVQNGSKWLHFSEKIMRAYAHSKKTEIHSENGV